MGVWVNFPEHELGRSDPTSQLPVGDVDEGELPLSHTHTPLTVCGSWESWPWVKNARELSLPLTAAALGRVSPVPHPGNTVELALRVYVWVSQP